MWWELSDRVNQRPPCVKGAVSYGGIAAEIGTKNMPPACFIYAASGGIPQLFTLLFSLFSAAGPHPNNPVISSTVRPSCKAMVMP